MATWIGKQINKLYLEQELRGRGICLRHGTKMSYDRSHGMTGYGGIIPAILVCQECQNEKQAKIEQDNIDFEVETAAMWKEYKKL